MEIGQYLATEEDGGISELGNIGLYPANRKTTLTNKPPKHYIGITSDLA